MEFKKLEILILTTTHKTPTNNPNLETEFRKGDTISITLEHHCPYYSLHPTIHGRLAFWNFHDNTISVDCSDKFMSDIKIVDFSEIRSMVKEENK